MTEVHYFLVGLVVGAVVGIYCFHQYHSYRAKKVTKKLLDDLMGAKEDFIKNLERDISGSRPDGVDEKLKKVDELQKELMGLAISNDEPQRNSLDGRGRQNNYGRFEQIQDEITEILQSIIDDGHDPILMVSGPDGVGPVKLSEVMQKEGFIGNRKEEEKEGERTTESGNVLQLVKPKEELPPIPANGEDNE